MESNEILQLADRLCDELEHPRGVDECIRSERAKHIEETRQLCRFTSGFKIDEDAKPRGLTIQALDNPKE